MVFLHKCTQTLNRSFTTVTDKFARFLSNRKNNFTVKFSVYTFIVPATKSPLKYMKLNMFFTSSNFKDNSKKSRRYLKKPYTFENVLSLTHNFWTPVHFENLSMYSRHPSDYFTHGRHIAVSFIKLF